ncbi:hypothetical protein ACROYT_G012660 [Oculina patagonica]
MSFSVSIGLCALLFVASCSCTSFIKDSKLKLRSEPGIGPNKLVARHRRQAIMRYCNRNQYNTQTELCCNDEIVPLIGNQTRCCDTEAFDPWTQMCCDGSITDILPGMTHPTCCGSQVYDAGSPSSLCCSGNVFYAIPMRGMPGPVLACCGSNGYNTATQVCCDDRVFFMRASMPGCCGGRPYDAATQLCCKGRPVHKPGHNAACCGRLAYNSTAFLCCHGHIVRKADLTSICCGSYTAYNAATELCCSGHPVPRTRPTVACCGRIGYDTATNLCCNGNVQLKSAVNSRCCGRSEFNPATHLCCDGSRPIALMAFGGGCGGHA